MELANFDFPLIKLDRVFHIGTLNPADLGRNSGSSSLEGTCLSVSLCPHAWQAIARLGGYPLHELHNPEAVFVDMHTLAAHADLPEILAWAVEEGLAIQTELWKAWYFDDEAEEWRYELHEDLDDAIDTADPHCEHDDPMKIRGPRRQKAIQKVTLPIGTSQLSETVGIRIRADEDATDAVLLAFAMLYSNADGVWWDETYSPEDLSAPRGGIFPERVRSWNASITDWSQVSDMPDYVLEKLTSRLDALGSSIPRV